MKELIPVESGALISRGGEMCLFVCLFTSVWVHGERVWCLRMDSERINSASTMFAAVLRGCCSPAPTCYPIILEGGVVLYDRDQQVPAELHRLLLHHRKTKLSFSRSLRATVEESTILTCRNANWGENNFQEQRELNMMLLCSIKILIHRIDIYGSVDCSLYSLTTCSTKEA